MTDAAAAPATPVLTPAVPAGAPEGAALTPVPGQQGRDLLNAPAAGPTGAAAPADPVAPGATAAAEPTKPADAKPEDAPKLKAEDYKLTMVDGLDAKDPAVGAFVAAAAEQGIAPEAAQKLLNAVAPEIAKALQAPLLAWDKTQKDWQAQVRNDPEIGGAKLDQTVLPTIEKAIEKYGAPGIGDALVHTGAGNNLAIIKTLYTLSRMVTEGTPVQGTPAYTSQTNLQRMYPSAAKTA